MVAVSGELRLGSAPYSSKSFRIGRAVSEEERLTASTRPFFGFSGQVTPRSRSCVMMVIFWPVMALTRAVWREVFPDPEVCEGVLKVRDERSMRIFVWFAFGLGAARSCLSGF